LEAIQHIRRFMHADVEEMVALEYAAT